MQRKALVIINPRAGGFKRDSILRSIERRFAAAGIAYEIHAAEGADTLGAAVREQMKRGFDLVVAAGGDGTVSSAAEGLEGSDVPLGIVPIGTGNILARDLRIPRDIDGSVRLICESHTTRTIDAMRIGGRLYVLTIGVGISSLTVRDLKKEDKRRFGLLAYVGGAIRKLFEFKTSRIEVVVDGETYWFDSPEIAVANSGGVADMVMPHAIDITIDDGVLDVIVLKARGPLDYPLLLYNALRRHVPSPSVRLLRAKRSVILRPDRPLPVQADGDIIGTSPVEVEVVPHAVKIIVPRTDPGSIK
jgi:YegS/Rv2252/BmrU family lipid kinase